MIEQIPLPLLRVMLVMVRGRKRRSPQQRRALSISIRTRDGQGQTKTTTQTTQRGDEAGDDIIKTRPCGGEKASSLDMDSSPQTANLAAAVVDNTPANAPRYPPADSPAS